MFKYSATTFLFLLTAFMAVMTLWGMFHDGMDSVLGFCPVNGYVLVWNATLGLLGASVITGIIEFFFSD